MMDFPNRCNNVKDIFPFLSFECNIGQSQVFLPIEPAKLILAYISWRALGTLHYSRDIAFLYISRYVFNPTNQLTLCPLNSI